MQKIKDLSFFPLIAAFIFLSQVVAFILSEISYLIAQNRNIFDIYTEEDSLSEMLFESVVLAPIFETLIFMGLLEFFILIFKEIKKSNQYVIFLGGLIFGSLHFYSWFYIFVSIILWHIFAFYYIFIRKKYSSAWIAAAALVLIHSGYNLITIYFDYVI